MRPDEIKNSYDQIAEWWRDTNKDSLYGLSLLLRALQFAPKRGVSLDVGCGSQGRFIRHLTDSGYKAEGMDISAEMVALAAEQLPGGVFYSGDICKWELPKKYDFISAWDSTFHLPLEQHEPVLRKLCQGLNSGGVIMFTCGGGDVSDEVTGSFAGQNFAYSTLGVSKFLQLLESFGCTVKHVEYDQFPENHVTIIARKA